MEAKSAKKKRSVTINVSLTEIHLNMLDKLAEWAGISRSDYLRRLIDTAWDNSDGHDRVAAEAGEPLPGRF